MGIGMALFEHPIYDDQNHEVPINSNLADYVVTTNADAPEIAFLDYPDTHINDYGARHWRDRSGRCRSRHCFSGLSCNWSPGTRIADPDRGLVKLDGEERR